MKKLPFCFAIVWALCAAPAWASGASGPERQFSETAGTEAVQAQKFIEEKDYSAAAALLERALSLPQLSPYEQSTLYQMRGLSHYELGDYGAAIFDFGQAISAGGLLPNEVSNLRVNIAQLLIANEEFAKGAQMLEDWQQAGGVLKRSHEEMLWQAWSQAKMYDRALPWAEQWVGEIRDKQRQHYDLLNFFYAELGMDAKQAGIIKEMISRWPEDTNLWRAWASLLAKAGREEDAFEIEKILYIQGTLTKPDELRRLVQYYAYYGMPYQAARILEKELNTGRIPKTKAALSQLADLLRQAREYEKAIPVLELAALDSGEGVDYAKLAEAYYHKNNCTDAESAAQKAAKLNYFKSAKLYEQIGVCYYEAAQDDKQSSCFKPEGVEPRRGLQNKALAAFKHAEKSGAANPHISNWQNLILAEQKRDETVCNTGHDIHEEVCMVSIRRAYDNKIFAKKFILTDQSCLKYKDKYDRLYKRK